MVFPPPAFYEPCVIPFDKPPLTHSEEESAIRDMKWKSAMDKCAAKPDRLKAWYQSKQADK